MSGKWHWAAKFSPGSVLESVKGTTRCDKSREDFHFSDCLGIVHLKYYFVGQRQRKKKKKRKVQKQTTLVLRRVRTAIISLHCLHCSAFSQPARKFLQCSGSTLGRKQGDASEPYSPPTLPNIIFS